MNKIRTHLLAATAVVALSSAAYAADMGMPLKAPPPPPPPVQDWSGVYVGLEGGYGWGKQNTNFDPFFGNKEAGEFRSEFCSETDSEKIISCGPVAAINSVNQSGWLGGGFAGVQKQWGSWVLGMEADFDAADIKGSQTVNATPVSITGGGESESLVQQHTLNTEIDELGTVRGKVGWAWSPNWMVYGTGGLALAHVKDNFSASQNLCFQPSGECEPEFDENIFTGPFSTVTGSGGMTMFGWTVGAGLDYKWQIDQGSAVIFGVEYLHYQFDQHSLAFGGPSSFGELNGSQTFTIGNVTQTIDTIKGRISYLFSIH